MLKLINLIFRNFRVKNFHFYNKLYKIYILPSIFYRLPVYFINTIEQIQKYFTKRVYKRCFPNEKILLYIDRLKSINMPSLESQCVKVDLCTLFKVIGGLIIALVIRRISFINLLNQVSLEIHFFIAP